MLDKTKVVIPEQFKDHPIFNEHIYGTNFGFLAKRGYYFRPEVQAQPELMKKRGVNWTTVNMNFCQPTYFSRHCFLDFEYSTGELELAEIVKRLHANGIKVLFKPCLTNLDGSWMGLVDFPENTRQIEGVNVSYWDEWFGHFTEGAKYFADLAERLEMDAMIIGAEYLGTEGQNARWENVISEVRKIYSGPISYEFTPDSRKKHNLKWFEKLDFLCHSYYPPACPRSEEDYWDIDANTIPDYSLDEMVEFLDSRKNKIMSVSERFGNKPIVFTEFGVRSSHGSIMYPTEIDWKARYDGEMQANYMEAGFKTFSQVPQWMGFFWWKWDETQNRPNYHTDPAGDKGFTIQGKPAEEVFKRYALNKLLK